MWVTKEVRKENILDTDENKIKNIYIIDYLHEVIIFITFRMIKLPYIKCSKIN